MSLSGALNNAISGLTAAKRSAQVASSNLANVMTEGYGLRSVALEANSDGAFGGVRVLGVVRHVNPALLAEVREARMERAAGEERLGFAQSLEAIYGTPDQASSLNGRLAKFEADLAVAASRPDQTGRLDNAVMSAKALAQKVSEISQGLQEMRTEADRRIARATTELNAKLKQIEELNGAIASTQLGQHDASAYLDQRQRLIDQVSEWIPLVPMARPNGAVALYSAGGIALLDGQAAEISFTPSNVVAPHMTLENGLLSGMSVNARPVTSAALVGGSQGGRLGALFELRDETSVAAQAEIDAFARDLAERFQVTGLDPTRGAGETGLFTDAGALVTPADEIGLAGRLEVNALVDPAEGGESWRLRDGLGAAAQGPVGNASLLQGFSSALAGPAATPSGQFSGQLQSANALLGQIVSQIGSNRLRHEQEHVFSATRAAEVETLLASEGVDTDQEMQRLMMIEQAYTANAQMLKTVDDMLDALMRAVS